MIGWMINTGWDVGKRDVEMGNRKEERGFDESLFVIG